MIIVRLDGKDYIDWRDPTPIPASYRLCTPAEIAALQTPAPPAPMTVAALTAALVAKGVLAQADVTAILASPVALG